MFKKLKPSTDPDFTVKQNCAKMQYLGNAVNVSINTKFGIFLKPCNRKTVTSLITLPASGSRYCLKLKYLNFYMNFIIIIWYFTKY